MKRIIILIGLFSLASCSSDDGGVKEPTVQTRPFYMGFTAFPYDLTVDASVETYQNVIQAGDLFLNHFDHGVPWNEALNDLPFPNEVQGAIDVTKNGLEPNTKILLTATPTNQLRDGLAAYWNDAGSHQPLPDYWKNKTFDDSDVILAYTNYCKRIVDEIRPDYFAYGIEVTAAFREDDAAFEQFLVLADSVYSTLKSDYPNLPIFLTFQDRSFNNTKEELLKITEALLPFSDYIAMSTYPFIDYENLTRDANPSLFEDNWLSQFRNLDTTKPFAISETGFCADDLVIPNLGVDIKATPEWQEAYLKKLFDHATGLEAEFLAWFVYRDYDLLYDATPNPPDILKIWRDNGLLDGEGNPRLAHQVWLDWKARTKN